MLTIRSANIADSRAIQKINAESLDYQLEETQTASQLADILACPFYRIWVAEHNDTVCGYLQACDHLTTGTPPYKLIIALAVLPSHQGQGIGKKLLQTCEQWAKSDSSHSVRLFSSTGRTKAHEFYEKFGYSLRKTHKNFEKFL